MKKELLLLFCFLFVIQSIFLSDYSFMSTKDTAAENTDTMEIEIIKQNTILTSSKSQPFYFSRNDNFFGLELTYNDNVYFFNADFVNQIDTTIKLPQVIKKSYWIMNYYYDSLYMSDINIILDNEFYLKSKDINKYAESFEPWEYYFSILMLKFGDFYFYGRHNWEYGDLNVFAKLISVKKNIFVYEILETECLIFDKKNKNMWQPEYRAFYEKETPFEIYIVQDGDYLDLYIDSISKENHLHTLARADDNTIKQITNFVKQKSYDLSLVTFPRRADKNHTVGISCIVAENLRLRKEESTSSATLQTMQVGTQVKILQLGKKQTIDGITANWVQVGLADGTRGWCFGGYLVEK